MDVLFVTQKLLQVKYNVQLVFKVFFFSISIKFTHSAILVGQHSSLVEKSAILSTSCTNNYISGIKPNIGQIKTTNEEMKMVAQ